MNVNGNQLNIFLQGSIVGPVIVRQESVDDHKARLAEIFAPRNLHLQPLDLNNLNFQM